MALAVLFAVPATLILLATLAAATGLVCIVGFVAAGLLPLKALVWANLHRHWHAVWGLGLISAGITVLVLCLFTMPLRFSGPTGVIVLLAAAMQVAVFQRQWLLEREGASRQADDPRGKAGYQGQREP